MTMRKVRLKKLKKQRLEMIKYLSRSHRSRIDVAVNNYWTLREQPDFLKELESERMCLRAEITVITVKERGNKVSNASVLIAEKLKRIDYISQQINNRKLHV